MVDNAMPGQFPDTMLANSITPSDQIVSMQAIIKELEGKEYKVIYIEKKETRRNPLPPFITSTLQQTSSSKLGYGAKRTMMIAQKLY